MSSIVCKFGGSSLASPAQFLKVKNIVDANPSRKVVVVSAPGKRTPNETKITDLLYAAFELANSGIDISSPFSLVRKRFLGIEKDLNLDCGMKQHLDLLEHKIIQGVNKDYLASRGEHLNGLLMASYLGAEFVDPEMSVFFDNLGRIDDKTYDVLAKTMSDPDKRYVLPGFYGVDPQGEVKTFSRGGSDISGSIAARAIKAVLYENWTDVSGLLMADPRIVKNPKPMKVVTYREIRELAYMGANVFHDEAIAPIKESNIPIQIKNTNHPKDKGTTIVASIDKSDNVVAGIAGKQDAVIFTIDKAMMNKEKGFGRKILGIFESNEVSYEHSPTGIDSMCVVVLKDELGNKGPLICDTINRVMQPDKVTIEDDISLIATVGEGMQHAIGTAAKLFGTLSKAGINVRIIDQGSSEVNIIVGVHRDDYEKAIQTLYQAFVNPNSA